MKLYFLDTYVTIFVVVGEVTVLCNQFFFLDTGDRTDCRWKSIVHIFHMFSVDSRLSSDKSSLLIRNGQCNVVRLKYRHSDGGFVEGRRLHTYGRVMRRKESHILGRTLEKMAEERGHGGEEQVEAEASDSELRKDDDLWVPS